MMLALRSYLLVGLAGIASEVFIFSKGEWDRHSPTILKFLISVQALVTVWFKIYGFTLLSSIQQTCVLTAVYAISLFTAMSIYRLFFHPLRGFPGPIAARVSVFWILKQNLPQLLFYRKLRQLHNDYGDFVRTRPRELSICHPDAVMDILGPRSKVVKGEFYEHMWPHQNLQLTRDIAFHKSKRRVWDKAFSPSALRDYVPRLAGHHAEVIELLDKHSRSGVPVDVTRVFMDVQFDVISDFSFGKSWNMLTSGKPHPLVKDFVENKRIVGFLINFLWIFHLTKLFPGVEGMIDEMLKEYGKMLEERRQMRSPLPDFYTYFSQNPQAIKDGPADAQLAVIAGADTTALTLIHIFYILARYPDIQSNLHAELDPLPASAEDSGLVSDQYLAPRPYLNGIINEVLRLYSPVPAALQRLTPPEGATIAGRYVPGNMNVSVPTYALHRDPRAFAQPDEFIPERWSSQPELIIRKDAFIAFSYGPENCVGRPLAMMQLRMLVARIARRFEVSVPKGADKEWRKFEEEKADCFVLDVRKLPMVFKERVKH